MINHNPYFFLNKNLTKIIYNIPKNVNIIHSIKVYFLNPVYDSISS